MGHVVHLPMTKPLQLEVFADRIEASKPARFCAYLPDMDMLENPSSGHFSESYHDWNRSTSILAHGRGVSSLVLALGFWKGLSPDLLHLGSTFLFGFIMKFEWFLCSTYPRVEILVVFGIGYRSLRHLPVFRICSSRAFESEFLGLSTAGTFSTWVYLI